MTTTLTPDTRPTRVGKAFIAVYSLAYFGVYMALLTPVIVTMALRVAQLDPANKETNLSLILGVGALIAMLTNPVAGLLSDRTTARMGMRKPWLIGGGLLGLAGLAAVASGTGVFTVLLGWCAAQLGFNALLAALTAILPDQVPESQRGSVSGLLGICVPIGVLSGVGLTQAVAGQLWLMFMLPAAVATVLVTVLLLALDDRRKPAAQVPALNLPGFLKSFWIDPRKAPDFSWAFASRFLVMVGMSMMMTYQVFYLGDRLHFRPDQIPGAMLTSTLTSTLATVVGSGVSGWLSDRLQRRKVFVLLAAAINAVGLLVIGLSPNFAGFLTGAAISGLGLGVYLAVDLALVTEVLPNKDTDAAKDMGIFNLASALPQSVAPAIAPLFLGIGTTLGTQPGGGNYGALFFAAAAFSLLGALAVLPIRGVR